MDAGWRHSAVRVARSPIAGRGLFATAPLAAGIPVVRIADAAVAIATSSDEIDCVNHSCDPNLGWGDSTTLMTLRDVEAGQELTSDYAMATTDPAFLLRCHCETYRCRQLVTGDDWRIPQLQRRYAGHWAPAVERLLSAVDSADNVGP
jgi:hypothetical protein